MVSGSMPLIGADHGDRFDDTPITSALSEM
jgi:hypothetical protein